MIKWNVIRMLLETVITDLDQKRLGLKLCWTGGQVLVAVGKISQDRKDWLEWSHVLRAFNLDVNAYDFDVDVEAQVKRISELLQQYCTKLLDGDFGDERLLREIENVYGRKFLRRFLQH